MSNDKHWLPLNVTVFAKTVIYPPGWSTVTWSWWRGRVPAMTGSSRGSTPVGWRMGRRSSLILCPSPRPRRRVCSASSGEKNTRWVDESWYKTSNENGLFSKLRDMQEKHDQSLIHYNETKLTKILIPSIFMPPFIWSIPNLVQVLCPISIGW